MGYVVEARDLVKRFDSLTAVDRVSFQVGGGECVGFLGPNGAGKTTILRTLYGLARLTSGELAIFGWRAAERMREIKRRIGVVPQETTLDADLTVQQNLVVYARYFDIPTAVARERAGELLARFHLKEKAEANLGSLSGGMKRRLLIARALINRPDLLILDEPTTGLDAQSRHLVWSHLEMQRSNGLAILLTTQHMEEAERLCGRILVIDAGRIIAEGDPHSLVREARVANLEQLFLKLTGTELRD